jgi:phosphate starvation-inducible PhoH-like protein
MARKRQVNQPVVEESVSPINKILTTKHRLKFKNKSQKEYSTLITDHEIVIAAGPAGTGKSYVSIARAIELLQNKTNKFEKILILKPAIEADEKHGFLPGDMREKMEPYVASSLDIIDKIVGEKNRKKLEEMGIVKVEALAYIRGKSIDNSILIMEEAQNMSPSQVKTLLTRIGENSKFIISGDLDQSDRYRKVEDSGLYDAIHRHRNLDVIGFYEFTKEDIIRNPIISKILANYNREEKPMSGSTRPQPPRPTIQPEKLEDKRVRNLKARWKTLIRKIKKLLRNG